MRVHCLNLRLLIRMSTYKKVAAIDSTLSSGTLTVGGTVDLGATAQTSLSNIDTATATLATTVDAGLEKFKGLVPDAMGVEQRGDATYGHKQWRVWGNGTTDGSGAFRGIMDGATTQPPFGQVAAVVSIVSTSANDDLTGTHARTVRVVGALVDGTTSTEDVDLDGLTPVTTVSSYRSVHSLLVVARGTTGFNNGIITATISGNEAAIIAAFQSCANVSAFTPDLGKLGMPVRMQVWTDTLCDVLLEISENDGDGTGILLNWRAADYFVLGYLDVDFRGWEPLKPSQTLKVSIKSTGAQKFVVDLFGYEA